MQKWEYKILKLNRKMGEWLWVDTQTEESREDRLNILGKDGWELVSVSTFLMKGSTYAAYYFFKRPLVTTRRTR